MSITDLPPEMTVERVQLYSRLFQLEIWFRELVYVEMKCHFGADWWQRCEAALKRSKRPGIPAGKSLKRDKRHPHMATPENDPLWFISFESLMTIVFDARLWKIFEPYLTTKTLVRAKIEELMPVRNRIAHARALHPDDLTRVENVMRDLDQGFWGFCTSYNDARPFIAERRSDPIFRQFVGRMYGGYVETERNEWSYVANRTGAAMDVDISYGVRPSAKPPRSTRHVHSRGAYYIVRFSVAHTQRALESADVLTGTKSVHLQVIHILLDSYQSMLTITIPALLDIQTIVGTVERFYEVCRNATTRATVGPPHEDGEDPVEWSERLHRPMRQLASQWPHYVIPPSHPFCFLGPDCPCSFFGV